MWIGDGLMSCRRCGCSTFCLVLVFLLTVAQGAQGDDLQGEGSLARAQEALALSESTFGPKSEETATALGQVGAALVQAGRLDDAVPFLVREVEILEKASGRPTPETGKRYQNLADVLLRSHRSQEGEAYARRALSIVVATSGSDDVAVASASNTLAIILNKTERATEAEPLAKRAVDIYQAIRGPESPEFANALSTLVATFEYQERFDDAERLARKVLAISEKNSGPDSDNAANVANTLAGLLKKMGRLDEAEQFARRVVASWDRIHGADSGAAANARNSLSNILQRQGRMSEAIEVSKRIVEIWDKVEGPRSNGAAVGRNNLAYLYLSNGFVQEAESLFTAARDIWADRDGPRSRAVGVATAGLADATFARGDWALSYAYRREALMSAIERSKRDAAVAMKSQSGQSLSEIQRSNTAVKRLAKAAWRMGEAESGRVDEIAADVFAIVQGAENSAAGVALAQTAQRAALGNPSLARAMRSRQDIAVAWQDLDKRLIAMRSSASDMRDAAAEAQISKEMRELDERRAAIDAELTQQFSNFASLNIPEPSKLSDVQTMLDDKELLIVLLDTEARNSAPEETFIWAITKSSSRWVRSPVGTKTLGDLVAGLRCGLDPWSWSGAGRTRCGKLLGVSFTGADAAAGKPLPFDAGKSGALYKALFGQLDDLLIDNEGKGRRLLIVASGPLQQLPFHVLQTSSEPGSWLVRRHAVTVLPSVASLKALRVAGPGRTAGMKPYLAFANPLLVGAAGDEDDRVRAERAEQITDCASVYRMRELALAAESFRAWRSVSRHLGSVKADELRRLPPVPQTADLACDVAKAVGASEADIHLGARATEASLKAMSASGELAAYAVVNFATHGAVAGEFDGSSEPGLVLTPPSSESETDDGYLSASEVGSLALDADWVILSACNTAAGGAGNAEALSGLARAFFYAGARALLVSHWSVRESAAVTLVTRALAATAADGTLGRAEAMRQAMLSLADAPDPALAHPSYWAPFALVGDGGRR